MSRVLVVGCGSIGSRRARVLREMGHEVQGMDADESRWIGLPFDDKDPEAVFICTPPDNHLASADAHLWRSVRGLFIEKPLSLSMDGIPELIAECESRKIVTMGACNLRFAYSDTLPDGPLDLCVTKPLPDWRPGAEEAYRANGIVLEMAIHELDLACVHRGPILSMEVRNSNADRASLYLQHERGTSQIRASWGDGAPTYRSAQVGETILLPNLSDDMYRREMAHFLECVEAGKPTCNPLSNAAHVLEWALKAQAMIRSEVPA